MNHLLEGKINETYRTYEAGYTAGRESLRSEVLEKLPENIFAKELNEDGVISRETRCARDGADWAIEEMKSIIEKI